MKNLRVCLLIVFAMLLCVAFVPIEYPFQVRTASAVASERVYIGGFPIGITLDVGGLLVDGVTGVETEFGTARIDGFKKGDIIKKINGKDVRSVDDVQLALGEDVATVELIRDGKTITIEVRPLIEAYSERPRLGIRIKDKIYGVGTVTFVRQNGEYAALGHEIYDADTDTHIPFDSGKIYGCKILGIKKGVKGEAGALLGSIVEGDERGTISRNDKFGIAGTYTENRPDDDIVEVADRAEVRPGHAKIRTTIDDEPRMFDIEIIKASRWPGRNEKSLVFRVTDKKLIGLTGGVVRGMSGSPIIQNGKLVGAVTHVFINDPTRGYGILIDNMLNSD
ncbi:MAG: SpoIVB peptidase [Clostridiales bacterium]|nr:SpoIVB peptidase [Clostridiales bacterium]